VAYRIGRELGAGALGRVVELIEDGGAVWAGKLLHDSHAADVRAHRRFEVEARLLAGIDHPNLVGVRGLVHVDGRAALVMELVPGPDLGHVIAAEAPLPAARVIAIGRGIAAGLAVAHRAGLVHRDLKPANVLLGADGTPKVGDFGLARAASFASSDPDAAAVAGTPDYMAPEAIDPLAIDARSDLYALGCILCELATGAPPYRGATALAVLQAHRTAPIPALDGRATPPVPEGLRRVIRWLLAKSPADRPQSATEVEAALAAAGADSPAALAVLGDARVATGRRCAACGALGPEAVAVCFACGAAQLQIGPGPATVFVTGPGGIADKLDAALRQKLIAWLAANPALGLAAPALARELPRLPFVLVTGVDDASARALVGALRGLGLEANWRLGGRLALREIRAKGWTLSKRVALIGVTSVWYMFRNSVAGAVGGMVVIAAAALWGGFARSARPVGRLLPRRSAGALPSALDAALARVADVVPAMTAARHRDALRGVVERALALRDAVDPTGGAAPRPAGGAVGVPTPRLAALDPAGRDALDRELAKLIDHAALAASRLDQLEARLSPDDLRSDDEARRASWRVRDRWAARILQVTAFLDAMRARAAMARARVAAQADLDELRGHVAALGEIERSETGGGDHDGFAGGAGGSAPRGIEAEPA
jgi:serine/threonine-protein kinase